MHRAKCIAIVGAESTGKTTLARELARELPRELASSVVQGPAGRRVAWVPEFLREWCERAGRTPLQHEQAGIARAQHERIRAAAAVHDWVLCDTTALMTATYSGIVFADHSLDDEAVALHRDAALTLLTALDLPWVGDGLQRDGPHVREPVDAALRTLMHAHGIGFSVIAGEGAARTAHALAAVRAAMRRHAAGREDPARGLFSRLEAESSTSMSTLPSAPRESARRWVCECCVPEAEQALLGSRTGPVPTPARR